ncbi:META domain-containing protein [Sedimentitalea sp. HM32M-2]|uniref:META domain-containing protein n=1 Tax=Sedimentitalea sp. HM32M-2 TaxID=3351566 RepID=UPI003631E949
MAPPAGLTRTGAGVRGGEPSSHRTTRHLFLARHPGAPRTEQRDLCDATGRSACPCPGSGQPGPIATAWAIALALIALTLTAGLAGCATNETLSRYAGTGTYWRLTEFQGRPARLHATLGFPAAGQIAGHTPCHRYRASIRAPYPWFQIGPPAVAPMPCTDVIPATRYLDALSAMTEAEVSGSVLVLREASGREMVFTAAGGTPG